MLVIGDGDLADATQVALEEAEAQVTRLRRPTDGDIREALEQEVDSVAVLSEDDYVALRLALVVENVRTGVPLLVTVFSRSVATQLEGGVRNVRVMSLADVTAAAFAGPCLADDLVSVVSTPEGFHGVRVEDGEPVTVALQTRGESRWRRLLANIGSVLRPFEPSARILTAGLLGFLLILALDTVMMALVLGQPLIDVFYAAGKTIVTVGPNPEVEKGPAWFKVFAAVSMLAALGFTAIFTAGVVDRLLDRRLTTIVGRRVVPRRDHVVVVGLGQVGLRLCLLLRELGIPVLAVDGDPGNYNVSRAKDYGIPVVVGSAESEFLLRRLSPRRARALAAMTSDEVGNVSVAAAAHGVRPDFRVVLRTGGGVASESGGLFRIGLVRDLYPIGGSVLAAAALGSEAREGFGHEGTSYLVLPDGRIEPFRRDGTNGHAPGAVGAGPAPARAGGAGR